MFESRAEAATPTSGVALQDDGPAMPLSVGSVVDVGDTLLELMSATDALGAPALEMPATKDAATMPSHAPESKDLPLPLPVESTGPRMPVSSSAD